MTPEKRQISPFASPATGRALPWESLAQPPEPPPNPPRERRHSVALGSVGVLQTASAVDAACAKSKCEKYIQLEVVVLFCLFFF